MFQESPVGPASWTTPGAFHKRDSRGADPAGRATGRGATGPDLLATTTPPEPRAEPNYVDLLKLKSKESYTWDEMERARGRLARRQLSGPTETRRQEARSRLAIVNGAIDGLKRGGFIARIRRAESQAGNTWRAPGRGRRGLGGRASQDNAGMPTERTRHGWRPTRGQQ